MQIKGMQSWWKFSCGSVEFPELIEFKYTFALQLARRWILYRYSTSIFSKYDTFKNWYSLAVMGLLPDT